MMAQKHLHELLKEDQEPFQLKEYISERRCQVKRLNQTMLQPSKTKSIVEISTSKRNLCKHVCFLSFHDSPELRKSPLADYLSPICKSPCKNQNGGVYLHVPAKTAALLLEAAMRIQKQSSKPKTQTRNSGFGIFGSTLKRLKYRNLSRRRELCAKEDKNISAHVNSTKLITREENAVALNDKGVHNSISFSSCSCNDSRLSSAGLSDTDEEKSLDLEISTSCRSDVSADIEFVAKKRKNRGFLSWEKHFISNASQFSLKNNPSGLRTPDFSSLATSPTRHDIEGEVETLQKNIKLVEEEEEQFSPSSVLDRPFDDDGNGCDHAVEKDDDYDLERSYAIVQKTKQDLLQKLLRFEKLAGLDPIELAKRMSKEEDENDYQEPEDKEKCQDSHKLVSFHRQNNVHELIREVFHNQSCLHHVGKRPADMKRLVMDLIVAERREQGGSGNSEMVMKNICKQLDSWGRVDSNNKNELVDFDFRSEFGMWNKYQDQVAEIAMEIEISVLGSMMEEFSEDFA